MSTKIGQGMTPEQRAEYLKPFTLTSILKEEMMNLREENVGINIILKQASKSIKKDKFSALCYGLYYIKQEEESNYLVLESDWKEVHQIEILCVDSISSLFFHHRIPRLSMRAQEGYSL